ncbi:hypothetical protein MLD38_026682 [Melastoma candidum]|uniref:Uncharacterized protein n=1 Tax=Melastoma candidum TaxID=119954 RepID=A0ACB9P2J7_9MYRT|nr:hypothetical protein MLD38_026682 [Melastoma candidum]
MITTLLPQPKCHGLHSFQALQSPGNKFMKRLGIWRRMRMKMKMLLGPSPKRLRVGYIPDNRRSLMKQVALISSMVGPRIAASATDSAVSAIYDEARCSREIFVSLEGAMKHGTTNSDGQIVDTEMDPEVTPASDNQGVVLEENFLPLRARAATATALGAAAAHAKLLAEQEGKELQHLMSDIIEAQMKKVRGKIEHFEELEPLMEKEHAWMDKLKEVVFSMYCRINRACSQR